MKAIFKLTNIEPDISFLIYEVDKEARGGYTLLSSPDEVREYEIETSPEKIEELKSMDGYEFVREIEEIK